MTTSEVEGLASRAPCRASSADPYAASCCGDTPTGTPSAAARICVHTAFLAPPPEGEGAYYEACRRCG